MTPASMVAMLLALQPRVASDSNCPSADDIEENLSVLLPTQAVRPGTVAVVSRADGLTIHLQPEGVRQDEERTITVASGCAERAKAAAVAIATWWPTQPAAKDSPPAPPAPTLSPAAPGQKARAVTVAAGGFASLIDSDAAPGVRVEVAWSPRAGALALRLGLAGTGAHGGALGPGRAQFWRMAAEAGVAWSRGPLRLDGAAVVSQVFVEGQGYTSNRQSSGTSLGVSAGARLSWKMGRWAPWLDLRGLAWPQSQRIFVTDAAAGARVQRALPHGELQLGAGISVSVL